MNEKYETASKATALTALSSIDFYQNCHKRADK